MKRMQTIPTDQATASAADPTTLVLEREPTLTASETELDLFLLTPTGDNLREVEHPHWFTNLSCAVN